MANYTNEEKTFILDNLDREWRAPKKHRFAVRAFNNESDRDQALKSFYGNFIKGEDIHPDLAGNYFMKSPDNPEKFVLFDPPGLRGDVAGELAEHAKFLTQFTADIPAYLSAAGLVKKAGLGGLSIATGANLSAAGTTEAINQGAEWLAERYVQEHDPEFQHQGGGAITRPLTHFALGFGFDTIVPWLTKGKQYAQKKLGFGWRNPKQEDIDAAKSAVEASNFEYHDNPGLVSSLVESTNKARTQAGAEPYYGKETGDIIASDIVRNTNLEPTSIGMATGREDWIEKEAGLTYFPTNIKKLENRTEEFKGGAEAAILDAIDSLSHTGAQREFGVMTRLKSGKKGEPGLRERVLASDEWENLTRAESTYNTVNEIMADPSKMSDAFRLYMSNQFPKIDWFKGNLTPAERQSIYATAKGNLEAAEKQFQKKFQADVENQMENLVVRQLFHEKEFNEPALFQFGALGDVVGKQSDVKDFDELFRLGPGSVPPQVARTPAQGGRVMRDGLTLRELRAKNAHSRMMDYIFEYATDPQSDLSKKMFLAVNRRGNMDGKLPDVTVNRLPGETRKHVPKAQAVMIGDKWELQGHTLQEFHDHLVNGTLPQPKQGEYLTNIYEKLLQSFNEDPIINKSRNKAIDVVDQIERELEHAAFNNQGQLPLKNLYEIWKSLIAENGATRGGKLGQMVTDDRYMGMVINEIEDVMRREIEAAAAKGVAPAGLRRMLKRADDFYEKNVLGTDRFIDEMALRGDDADLFNFVMNASGKDIGVLQELKKNMPVPHFDALRGTVLHRLGWTGVNGEALNAFSPVDWARNWQSMEPGIKDIMMRGYSKEVPQAREAMETIADLITRQAKQEQLLTTDKAQIPTVGKFLAQPLVAGAAVGTISALSGAQFGVSTATAFAGIYSARYLQKKLKTWQMDFMMNPQTVKWLADGAKIGKPGDDIAMAGQVAGHIAKLEHIAAQNPEMGVPISIYLAGLMGGEAFGADAEMSQLQEGASQLKEELSDVSSEMLIPFLQGDIKKGTDEWDEMVDFQKAMESRHEGTIDWLNQ